MVQRAKGAKIYKSMQGKMIDLDLLRKRQELTPAVGNARVNARGDELGPGGQIIRKKEDVVKEYYENAKSVPDQHAVKRPTKKDLTEDWVEPDENWVEDKDGNFVKKGKK